MHTVLVIFYQNCTIMSKTCGTFIPFLCYANANVETRHFRIQRYLKHKGSLKKLEFSLSGGRGTRHFHTFFKHDFFAFTSYYPFKASHKQ